MNPDQMLVRLKAVTSALAPGQLLTLGATFLLVVGLVVGSAYWLNTASYRLLYSDMDAESATEVLARTVGELQGQTGTQTELEGEFARPRVPERLNALTNHVSAMASEEPENAARLVRSWLNQDGR